MKILMAMHNMNYGGTTTLNLSLAGALQKRGHEITFLSSGGAMLDKSLEIGKHYELASLTHFSGMPYALYGYLLKKEWKKLLLGNPPSIKTGLRHEIRDFRCICSHLKSKIMKKAELPILRNSLHYTAGMILGYGYIREIIREREIDAIIASQATPIFLTFLATRWNYDVRRLASIRSYIIWQDVFPPFGLSRLLRQDDRIVAGTREIADNIERLSKIAPARIGVSPFAVDTEFYSPQNINNHLREKLGIDQGNKVILHISALRKEHCSIIHKIINAVKALWHKGNKVNLLILGGREGYEEIQVIADAVNSEIGDKMILLAGNQSADIPKFINIADVVVAMGRCAREAMACEKPVVVQGLSGYAGPVNPESVEKISATNYTGRGFSNTTDLERDLSILLEDADLQQRLGTFGRLHIKEHDSLEKAADYYESALCSDNQVSGDGQSHFV